MLVGDAKAIAAGEYHSIVLKNNGDVFTTGNNLYGQLGDGKSGRSANRYGFYIYNQAANRNRFAFVIGTWDIALGNTLLGVGLE